MNITTQITTRNESYIVGQTIRPIGIMLHSVGVPQPSAEVFAGIFNNHRPNGRQVSVHAFIDDRRIIQTLPWDARAWHSGGAANNTHIGIELTEPSTIRYTQGSSFTDNNRQATTDFVRRTYENAIDLCVYLCRRFNLNPIGQGVIISHSIGHQMGIASNHGDVEHLWNHVGLSVVQFRLEVQRRMQNNQTQNSVYEQEDLSLPSPWAQQAWALATQRQIIDGQRPRDNLTRQELITILHRMGLIT